MFNASRMVMVGMVASALTLAGTLSGCGESGPTNEEWLADSWETEVMGFEFVYDFSGDGTVTLYDGETGEVSDTGTWVFSETVDDVLVLTIEFKMDPSSSKMHIANKSENNFTGTGVGFPVVLEFDRVLD